MKKILIITYFSNQAGMACSYHIDDRLPLLLELGYEPVLLTSLCVPKWDRYIHYRVPSLSPSGLRFELRQLFLRKGKDSLLWKLRNILLLPLLPLYGLERLFARIDPVWYWQPLACFQARRICKRHSIDLIYSTGGPAVAHKVGSCLLKKLSEKRQKMKWVAEVQDPLIHSYCANTDLELQLLQKVERETYRKADRMIFLTRQAMETTEKRVAQTGKGVVVYPGAVPGAKTASSNQPGLANKMTLAHFGSLGGVRNLAPFINGLERAVSEQVSMKDDLAIILYGSVGGDDRERIDASAHASLFSLPGTVVRKEALTVMADCDILLLIQGQDPVSSQTIPSKLYEYLHVGRPVLAIVHENQEIPAMIEPLGHTCVSTEVKDIAQGLLKLYRQWKSKAAGVPLASPYTVRKAVEQIVETL